MSVIYHRTHRGCALRFSYIFPIGPSQFARYYGAEGHGRYNPRADARGLAYLQEDLTQELSMTFAGDELIREVEARSMLLHEERVELNKMTWESEQSREPESTSEYIVRQSQTGELELYHPKYQISLRKMLENAERFDREEHINEFNKEEAKSLLEMERRILSGHTVSAIVPTSHPTGVRYFSEMVAQEPIRVGATVKVHYIDVALVYGRNLESHEAKAVMDLLQAKHDDHAYNTSNGGYTYISSEKGSVSADDIRRAVIRQKMETLIHDRVNIHATLQESDVSPNGHQRHHATVGEDGIKEHRAVPHREENRPVRVQDEIQLLALGGLLKGEHIMKRVREKEERDQGESSVSNAFHSNESQRVPKNIRSQENHETPDASFTTNRRRGVRETTKDFTPRIHVGHQESKRTTKPVVGVQESVQQQTPQRAAELFSSRLIMKEPQIPRLKHTNKIHLADIFNTVTRIFTVPRREGKDRIPMVGIQATSRIDVAPGIRDKVRLTRDWVFGPQPVERQRHSRVSREIQVRKRSEKRVVNSEKTRRLRQERKRVARREKRVRMILREKGITGREKQIWIQIDRMIQNVQPLKARQDLMRVNDTHREEHTTHASEIPDQRSVMFSLGILFLLLLSHTRPLKEQDVPQEPGEVEHGDSKNQEECSAPWVLLSIIWQMTMMREGGAQKMPSANPPAGGQKSNKKKLTQRIPTSGVIFAAFS